MRTARSRTDCNPLIGAKKGVDPAYPDAQPTSVALIPIIQTFATFKGSESHQFDLLQGADNERVFSFFYLDPINAEVLTKSVTDTSGNAATITGPTCAKGKGGGGGGKGGGGVGQCEIVGQFLQRFDAALLPSGQPVGDFDNESVVKVVQLVE